VKVAFKVVIMIEEQTAISAAFANSFRFDMAFDMFTLKANQKNGTQPLYLQSMTGYFFFPFFQ